MLVGGNVKTSPSFRVFNHLLKLAEENIIYLPYEISSHQELEYLIQIFRRSFRLIELVISDPYKISVIKYLDELDESSKKAQSVNNIVKIKENRLLGSMFDGSAWVDWWKNILGKSLDNKKIIHLGAGGAGRAFAAAVVEEANNIELVFTDIIEERLVALREIIKSWGKDVKVKIIKVEPDSESEELNKELIDADIVVNGTGLGKTKGNIYAYPKLDYTKLKGKVCVDWNYRPAKNLFLKYSQDNGATVYNALGFLITGFYYTFHAISDKRGIFDYYKLLKFAKEELRLREATEAGFEGDERLIKAKEEISGWLPTLIQMPPACVIKEIKHRLTRPEIPFIEKIIVILDYLAKQDKSFVQEILNKLRDYFSLTGWEILSKAIEYHLPNLFSKSSSPLKIEKIGFVGLGRMGRGMVRRLLQANIGVVAFDIDTQAVEEITKDGAQGTDSLEDLIEKLGDTRPKIIWLMVPAGKPVEENINRLLTLLKPDDIIIDGGNSNPRDSRRRAKILKEKGIYFLDIGTSGGIEGAEKGVSLSVGGEEAAYSQIEPILKALACEGGISFIPYNGMGHLVKMVHNAMEYSFMQAIAESLGLLFTSIREEKDLDEPNVIEEIAKIVTDWSEDEVIGSYLLKLLSRGLKDPERFLEIGDRIGGGESGNWGLREAKRLKVSTVLLGIAVKERFRVSQPGYFLDTLISHLNQSYKFVKIQKGSLQNRFELSEKDVSSKNYPALIKEVHHLLAYTMKQIIYEGLEVIYQALRKDFHLDDKEAISYLDRILKAWCHGTIIRSFMLERFAKIISYRESLESAETESTDNFEVVLEYARRFRVPILLLNISAKKRLLTKENKAFLRESTEAVYLSEAFRQKETESFMSRIVSYLRWLFGRHPYLERKLNIVLTEGLGGTIKLVRAMTFISFKRHPENLPKAAKIMFERSAKEAIKERGRFTVALCGGRTPKDTFKLLKDIEIDWNKVHIFWVDERPPSLDTKLITNYELAYETFI
ncbi:MAG: NAD(P)-binding domain-containing protein, partial [Candidatus Omnitrophica bacterium]|nr:NAD(P)-binding domain-containing protein [Candidatus Omnitrophota bacterium]